MGIRKDDTREYRLFCYAEFYFINRCSNEYSCFVDRLYMRLAKMVMALILQIISAYKTKKVTHQVPDGNNTPVADAQGELNPVASNNNIPQVTEERKNDVVQEKPLEETLKVQEPNAVINPSTQMTPQKEKAVKTYVDLALNKLDLRKVYEDMPDNRNMYIQGDTVYINKNKLNAYDGLTIKRILAHEIYHSIEQTEEGRRIYELALEVAGDSAVQNKIAEYKAEGIDLDEIGAKAEIGADFIEKAMTDEKTIDRILLEDRTLAQRIFTYIKDAIAILNAKRTRTKEEAEELVRLIKARRKYEEALSKVQKGEYEAGFYGGKDGEVRTQSKKLGGYFPDNEGSIKDIKQYSISKTFENEYDAWVNSGKTGNISIFVGKTSKVLQSIGVKENDVRIDTKKIRTILSNHPEMTDEVIKSVPQVLEKPIIVMESLKNQQSDTKYNNRLVVFGELTDTKGNAVLVALELEPKNKQGNILNITKIASAYGKENIQYLLDNSRVLYIEPNKKRTNDWLRLHGLQLPIGLTNLSGSIGRITYNNDSVKRFSVSKKAKLPNQKYAAEADENLRKFMEDSVVVNEDGTPKVVYSGHGNTNLFGSSFDKNKATSGGFYFTEDPDIASSYAKGKMGNMEYWENGDEYRVKNEKGQYKSKLNDVRLTDEQVEMFDDWLMENYGWTYADLVKDHARYDYGYRKLAYTGGKRNLGNIHWLMEQWGDTITHTYTRENGEEYITSNFEELMDEMGIEWDSYTKQSGGVFPVYLNIKNPIDTSKPFPADLMQRLEKIALREKRVDWGELDDLHWTKDYPVYQWLEDIKEMEETGEETYWATQVPTKARKIMLEMGYDGIKDTGGKMGGDKHTVWIAFEPTQVKSAIGNRGTYDPTKKDIRYNTTRYDELVDEYGAMEDKPKEKVTYQFYENTFQNTPIFDDAVKEAELLYGHERERVSEKETVEKAKQRLEENGWEKEMRAISRKRDLDGVDTDVAMGIMSHMNDFEVGTDEFDRLMRFSEDYAEKTVESGQFIQALAKYSRTPTGLAQKGARDIQREQKKVQAENPKKWNKAEKNAVEINNAVKKAQEDSINEVFETVAKKINEKTAEQILTKSKKEKKDKKKNPAESLAVKISLHVEPKNDTVANAQLQKDIINELYKLAKESPLPDRPINLQKKDYVTLLKNILKNREQYESVWDDAKEIVAQKYKNDPDKMKVLEDYFNNYTIPIYSKASLNRAIADEMKNIEVSWSDLLFDTKATEEEKINRIKKALLDKMELTDKELNDIVTNDIMHSLNTKVAEKAKKYLEQREKSKDEKDTKARLTAEEKIIRLVKKGIYSPDEAKRLVQSAFDVPTLTSEDMKNVMTYYEKAAEYEEGSYESRKWNAKAQSIIADKTPKTKAEKHNSYRRIMMLLNPTTWMRNIGGNIMFGGVVAIKNIPGGAIDAIVAKKTGVRTTSANPFADIKAFYEGSKKGTAEWARDIIEGVDTSNNSVREEYQLTSGKTWSDAKAYGKVLNKLEKAMSKGLQIGDRPIYEGAYAQRLNELKRLGYDTELETVQNMAKEYALERVFQNSSKISDAVISVRNRLGWFGRIILPFAQTPGNILDKTIDYSAVGGFVRAMGQLKTAKKTGVFDQKLFVDRMGRTFTGAGLIAMGYALAASGLLVGGEDDNYKVRQAERLGGKKKYALHIDGKYYTIDWASPTAAVLLAGAEAYEAGLEEDDLLAIAAASGQAMINSIFATSLLSNLETLMSGGYGDDPDIAKAITNAIVGAASQYFPAIVRKANNVIDPVQRDTYDPNVLKSQWKYLQSGIPVLSYLLEPKYDIEGKVTMKSQGRDVGSRIVENFILPMNVSTEYHSKVNDELLRLYKETGKTEQFLHTASKKVNLGSSGNYVLTAGEHNVMQKQIGRNSVKAIENLMDSAWYKGVDDETKATAIGDIVSYYESEYKVNYAKTNNIDYENSTYAKTKEKLSYVNNDWGVYFNVKNGIADIKEANSNIEKASDKSNANKKQIAKLLSETKGLSNEQRQEIWANMGGYDGKNSDTYKEIAMKYGYWKR